MKVLCLLALLATALPVFAAEEVLKIDRSRSYVDIDVDATANFTGRLERYDVRITVDNGKIKAATMRFGFGDLKTGKEKRDADMLSWLGGGAPQGEFSLSVLALAPSGDGQATGRLTMHGKTELIEFPVNVTRKDNTFVISGAAIVDHRRWGLKVIRQAFVLKVDPEVRVRFQFTGELPEKPVAE